jgi:hypothetical protein
MVFLLEKLALHAVLFFMQYSCTATRRAVGDDMRHGAPPFTRLQCPEWQEWWRCAQP